MTVYLVRHAKAGDRSRWEGDDRTRPLSGTGRAQAAALVERLADATFEHIVASPYVRCLETVLPLASARGIALEPDEALAEGASLDAALALLRKHSVGGAVLCSHGDVIPMLLDHLAGQGVDLGPGPQCAKGSTWVLETDPQGEVRRARYLGPPA